MLKKYLKILRDLFVDKYVTKIYSQEGEDLIALRFFNFKNTGFYLDIGAHHPKRFSNTYLLYKRGWSGINIDAMPGSMLPFKIWRARDINLEFALGPKKETKTFYVLNEPALNTFDEKLALERIQNPIYKIINKVSMEVLPLAQILETYLSPNQALDFLTIDVEGLDLEILKTNDWGKYRPKLICVEIYAQNMKEIIASELSSFLQSHQYEFLYRSGNSCFFKLCSQNPLK
jgi:hypothetical protein